MHEDLAGEGKAIVKPDPSFVKQMREVGEADVSLCYQCLKCSSGCPVAFAMDYMPHQIIRLVQLGLREEVLRSSTIWLCASCETCVTRCPNDVDLPRVMDALRQMARREGIQPAEADIACFHEAFMQEILNFGRVHEMSLIARYKLRTRQWLRDLGLGLQMFLRGRLSLLPARVKERKKIRTILQKAKKP